MPAPRIVLALSIFLASAFLFVACPTDPEERQTVLDIPIDHNNDSLLSYDTLIITVYSKDSSFVQEVFHDSLTNPKQLMGIKLDGRLGKEFTVSIIGYKSGAIGMHREVKVVNLEHSETRDLPVKDTVSIKTPIPELLAPTDTSVLEGQTLRFRVDVRNPWEGRTSLSLKDALPGASLDTVGTASAYGYFSITPTHSQGRSDAYPVVIVYASADRRIEKTVRLTIHNVNRVPSLSPIPDQKVKENETLTITPQATDPDGDSIRIEVLDLPAGAQFASGSFTWKPSVGQAGNYSLKVKAFDGNDSDFTAILISVGDVEPPPPLTVEIVNPSRDTAVNRTPIILQYTVNGTLLQRQEHLKYGTNRIFLDTTVAGRTEYDTILITFDTIPPNPPKVKGITPVRSRTPEWTWTGSGGGSGPYRIRLDDENMGSATLLSDTSYTPPRDLDPGTHTLFVQERDLAGNWSLSGRHSIRIDTTKPASPVVTVNPKSPTNDSRPVWTWSATGEDIAGVFRLKLNSQDFRNGTIETTLPRFQPDADSPLQEGANTLYVQQRDSAGNWSDFGSATVVIDLTAPEAPKFTARPSELTNNRRPEWAWTRGSGGMGSFRLKLNDTSLATGSVITGSLTYKPDSNLAEGRHVLYIQERDSAGNWSRIASSTFDVDFTPPNPPVVTSAFHRTTDTKPTWSWRSGGTGGSGVYRYRLDDSTFLENTPSGADSSFTPATALSTGKSHTLYVQERDAAGNWSTSSPLRIHIHGNIAYAVGGSGTIIKTTDGGSTWDTTMFSGAGDATLQSVYFVDPDTGYVVGETGIILKTVTGGKSWFYVAPMVNKDLFGVFFPTPSTGIIVGDSGLIFRTVDGTIWNRVSSGIPHRLTALHFPDSKTGYIVGDSGTILKTTNGGSSWTRLNSGTGELLRTVYFVDPMTGYAAGTKGIILKTTDGGSSWKVQPTTNNTDKPFFSVNFVSRDLGYAMVGSYGNIYKTVDGGNSWTWITSGIALQVYSVFFTDANTGYAAGYSSVRKTTIGGTGWEPLPSGSSRILYAIQFL